MEEMEEEAVNFYDSHFQRRKPAIHTRVSLLIELRKTDPTLKQIV